MYIKTACENMKIVCKAHKEVTFGEVHPSCMVTRACLQDMVCYIPYCINKCYKTMPRPSFKVLLSANSVHAWFEDHPLLLKLVHVLDN